MGPTRTRRVFALVCTAALASAANAQLCKDTELGWDGEAVLHEASKFTVQWKFEGDQVVLAVSAENANWVGFGIAEETSGSMLGADIMTGRFAADGQPIVEDRFVPWQSFPFAPFGSEYSWYDQNVKIETSPSLVPVRDCEQDWTVEGGARTGTCTLVIARRAMVTEDTAHDRPILAGNTTRVIWAFGSTSGVTYHGAQRGSTTVSFSSPSAPVEPAAPNECSVEPNNCTIVDLTMTNYLIQAQETTYTCQSFDLSEREAHVIRIEPVIDNEPFVHHILLHVCQDNEFFSSHTSPQTCGGSKNGNSPLSGQCQSLLYAWAVGGGALDLPKEAGFLIGTGGARHVIVEIHYDNPARLTGQRDSTTIRLTTTTDKREHNAGVILAGDPTTAMFTLPKGVPLTHRVGECPGECTSTWSGPINVFASFLHMHAFGRRMWTNRVNAANELQETTNSIEFWNFGFQQLTPVSYQVNPGDSLFVHCEYDTLKWPADVRFGGGSLDEMCMDFLFYWPLQKDSTGEDLTMCGGVLSMPSFAIGVLGISEQQYVSVVASNPDIHSKMASSFCGGVVIDDKSHHLENIAGFDLPLQRTDPTWNGTHYQRDFEFAPFGADCSGGSLGTPPSGPGPSPSDDPNYALMYSPLPEGMTLYWRVIEETCQLSIRVSVQGERWISLAIGDSMSNAGAIIGMDLSQNGDVPAEVAEYAMTATSRSGITPFTGSAGFASAHDVEFAFVAGGTTLRANLTSIAGRKLNLGCSGSGAGSRRRLAAAAPTVDSILLAFGPTLSFEQHSAASRGAFTVDWVKGTVASSGSDKVIQAHAFLMSIVMGLLLPVLVFSASSKHSRWFDVHRGVAGLGLLVFLVALGLGVSAVSSHASTTHHKLGFAVLAFFLLNPVLGLLRPDKEAPRRFAWLVAHRLVGLFVLAGGWANVILGAELVELRPEFFGASSVTAAYVVVAVGAVIMFSGMALGAYKSQSSATSAVKAAK